jgi:hypothetical protein
MNRIDDNNGAKIIRALIKNTYLEQLELYSNNLDKEVININVIILYI